MGNSASSSSAPLSTSPHTPASKADDPSLITPVGVRADGTYIYTPHDQERIDQIVSQGRGYLSESGSVIIRGVRPPAAKESPSQPTMTTMTTGNSTHNGENDDGLESERQRRTGDDHADQHPSSTHTTPSTRGSRSLISILVTVGCALLTLVVVAVALLVVLLANNRESSNNGSLSEAPPRSTTTRAPLPRITTTAAPTENLRSTIAPTTIAQSNHPSSSPSMEPSSAPTQPLDVVLFRVIDDSPEGSQVYPVIFHPLDSRFLASGGCDIAGNASVPTLLIWDILSEPGVATNPVANIISHESLPGPPCVISAAFDPKGEFLGTGGRDNSTLLWNVSHLFSPSTSNNENDNIDVVFDEFQTGQTFLQLKGHDSSVWSVAWHPQNETLVATASRDGTVKLWDGVSGEELASLDHDSEVNSVSFHPNGTLLASGADDTNVRIWNLDTSPPENSAVLQVHTDWVSTVRYSPDGSLLASGSFDGTIALWNATTGQHLERTSFRGSAGHAGPVYFVAWSPNGRFLASASFDKTVRVWEVLLPEGKLRPLWTLDGHEDGVFSVAWSPDGKYLASGAFDAKIQIWELVGGERMRT